MRRQKRLVALVAVTNCHQTTIPSLISRVALHLFPRTLIIRLCILSVTCHQMRCSEGLYSSGSIAQFAALAGERRPDYFPTPFTRWGAGFAPDSFLHAAITANLLEDSFIRELPYLWLVAAGFVFAILFGLSAGDLSFRDSSWIVTVLTLSIVVISAWLFARAPCIRVSNAFALTASYRLSRVALLPSYAGQAGAARHTRSVLVGL